MLILDAVQATAADETTAKLWGADKSEPKSALEASSFQMRKITLVPIGNNYRRRRPRRNGDKKSNGKDAAVHA